MRQCYSPLKRDGLKAILDQMNAIKISILMVILKDGFDHGCNEERMLAIMQYAFHQPCFKDLWYLQLILEYHICHELIWVKTDIQTGPRAQSIPYEPLLFW